LAANKHLLCTFKPFVLALTAAAVTTATKMTKCNNLCCKVEAENRKMKMLIDSVFMPPPHFIFFTPCTGFFAAGVFVVVGRKVLSMGFFIAVGKSFYVPPLVANYWRLLRGFRGAGGHCKFIFHVSGFRLQLGKKKKKVLESRKSARQAGMADNEHLITQFGPSQG